MLSEVRLPDVYVYRKGQDYIMQKASGSARLYLGDELELVTEELLEDNISAAERLGLRVRFMGDYNERQIR